jgi:hypothetical protein
MCHLLIVLLIVFRTLARAAKVAPPLFITNTSPLVNFTTTMAILETQKSCLQAGTITSTGLRLAANVQTAIVSFKTCRT